MNEGEGGDQLEKQTENIFVINLLDAAVIYKCQA